MQWELEYSRIAAGRRWRRRWWRRGQRQDFGARQKEIIAATWNQLRNRFAEKKSLAENAKFLSEMQAKLKDQASRWRSG